MLSLPTLLSTRYGLEAALDLLNKYIPGEQGVSWVSKQTVYEELCSRHTAMTSSAHVGGQS